MRKVPVLALGLLAVLASPANALELKNARAAYGFLSAPRPNNKFLPGDMLNFVFEIEDLKVDDKTGVANLQQAMEILDAKNNSIFKQDPMAMEVPLFGAKRMPSFVRAIMTTDQKAGPYTLKVTVTDKLAKATKSLTYDFELLRPGFGIVQPFTAAVAFVNQDFIVNFGVTGMAKDKKTKMPDVELTLSLRDKDGKPLVATPVKNNIKDLHVDQVFDITKMTVVQVSLPLVLSQAGSFTVEVRAADRIGKEALTLSLPLTVVDASPYLNRSAGGR